MVALGVALGCAVPAAHASLSVPTGGPSTQFTDSRTADAVANFAAAIGGADNGATSGEHGSGFRHVSWDDIALNGSDPGSTALPGGHTVALSRGRLQPWGIELGPDVAVADDGFHSVNSNVQFTPYSLHDVWAPFNSQAPFNSPVAELDVVAPDGQASTPVAAQTRGLGVVFLNVRQADTTGIEYYNGDILLGRVFAPAGTGGPSFAGLLFPDPVVTRVVVVLGTAEIFSLDGSPAGTDPNTMVAGDDVTLAEPAAARGAVAATAGVPVNAALDTFTETDPNASPKALIDWGDGVRSVGTIVPGPTGTFLVAGNHPYAHTGSYVADVTVDDSSGPEQTKEINIAVGPRTTTTAVTCSPSPVAVSASTTCTATISDATGAGASAPTGVVSFSTTTPGAAFGQGEGCLLGPTAITGVSSCAVQFTPGLLPPSQAHVAAAYGGDSAHAASAATTSVGVRPQRCSLRGALAPGAPARAGRSRDLRRAVGRPDLGRWRWSAARGG